MQYYSVTENENVFIFFVVFQMSWCANARPFLCQTSPGCINVNNPFVACVILDIYNRRARKTPQCSQEQALRESEPALLR